MKIKRFVAQDMRQALRMVREALGEDAVILSNKSVEGGVELTAAIDLVTEPTEPQQTKSPNASTRRTSPLGMAPEERRRQPEPPAADVEPDALSEMREEMLNLRRWLQAELSSMSWHDMGQNSPVRQELMQRLMQLGLSPDIARELADRVAGMDDLELAWHKALFFLSGEIPVMEQNLLERGGIVALVGPTGVGKTTTIAKMAARYAMRHGHRNVALVTTDNFRIGARDQLQTYGRILNVPVCSVNDPQTMADTIESLADRRLVLIDTAGMGADDERFTEQVAMLDAVGSSLTTLLALSATTEATALEKAIALFSATRPQACLLTKLDEAASLGASLSAVIHSGLSLAYLADGQRVPEDLSVARSHPLVQRAAELFKEHAVAVDDTFAALNHRGTHANARA
jgi:flagellar biosynthesis protein FlhF